MKTFLPAFFCRGWTTTLIPNDRCMRGNIATEADVLAALRELAGPAAGTRRNTWDTVDFVAIALTVAALVSAIVTARQGMQTAALISATAFLLIPLLYVLYTVARMAWGLLPILGSPTRHVFGLAAKRIELKQRAVRELRRFPPHLLSSAEQALAAELEGIESRMSLLVGLLEKTGFIPAAVALYLAYLQYTRNEQRNDWADALFLGAFILYGASFFILAWRQSLRDQLWLLQRAKE
jgi:hypothetical protein